MIYIETDDGHNPPLLNSYESVDEVIKDLIGGDNTFSVDVRSMFESDSDGDSFTTINGDAATIVWYGQMFGMANAAYADFVHMSRNEHLHPKWNSQNGEYDTDERKPIVDLYDVFWSIFCNQWLAIGIATSPLCDVLTATQRMET
jgi:hypothetical protein